jgi:uncharacterized delta-60 repeat protein
MNRFWRFSLTMSALCIALAALAVGASAAKPHGGKGKKKPKPAAAQVDKSFGRGGVARIATSSEAPVRMAVAPNGRTYALQGSLLLAFEPDGKPAHDFGNNGRLRVGSTNGETKPVALAVDSQGRVLVDGTITLYPFRPDPPANGETPGNATVREAFVFRYLEDGSPDPTFGNAGEADTTFGLPRPTGEPGKAVEFERALVEATSLVVDPQDRPVVGGTYSSALYFCGYQNEHPVPFVGRLTATGTNDTSYGGKGYIAGGEGAIQALAETPEGGVATLSDARSCGPRSDPLASVFNALTENGDPSPALDPARPSIYVRPLIGVDSQGRSLLVSSPPYTEQPQVLLRLLPSGAVDTSFGFGGGIPLQEPVSYATAIGVDGKDRTLIAAAGPMLARYKADGKRDWTFGTKGVLRGTKGDGGEVSALSLDAKERIYAAGPVESSSLKTGKGIQITRFLPGK